MNNDLIKQKFLLDYRPLKGFHPSAFSSGSLSVRRLAALVKLMNLLISQLNEGENTFNYESSRDTWLGEVIAHIQKEGYRLLSPIEIALKLIKLEPDYYLKGSLKFSVEQACARCAENFALKVTHPFDVALAHVHAIRPRSAELTEESEELDVNYFEGNEIQLNPILEEQFFLSIPFQSVCQSDCKGICQKCGKNLNEGTCMCKAADKLNPFAVLENFPGL
jgi:uncharacterized protein